MKAKKIARFGLLVSLALILAYLESLIPLSFAVPGIRMGLPNIVIVFALYRLRPRNAVLISLLRILIASMLFGTVMSLAYSLAGAALSLTVMILMKKSGAFGITGVSLAGAVCHNLGQVLMAALVMETGRLLWYFPALCVSGVAAGLCVGLAAAILTKRIPYKP